MTEYNEIKEIYKILQPDDKNQRINRMIKSITEPVKEETKEETKE